MGPGLQDLRSTEGLPHFFCQGFAKVYHMQAEINMLQNCCNMLQGPILCLFLQNGIREEPDAIEQYFHFLFWIASEPTDT